MLRMSIDGTIDGRHLGQQDPLNLRNFEKDLRALNYKWARIVSQLVRSRAPRKDGKLKTTVRVEHVNQPGVSGFYIVVNAPQGWFTEYGTGRYSIAEGAPKKQWIYPKKGKFFAIDVGNAAYSGSKIKLNKKRTFRSARTARQALDYAGNSYRGGLVKKLSEKSYKGILFVRRIKGQRPQEWLKKILTDLQPHYLSEVDELCARYGFTR